MLDAFRKFFDRNEAEEPLIRHDNPNFVTESDKIINIIGSIAAAPHLCTISFSGSRKPFSTSILDFQPYQGYLILDEIRPPKGNDILRKRQSLKLSTFLNGVHLAFKLRIIDRIDNQGSSNYKAALPDRIYYPQRRTAPRIFIHSTELKFHSYFPEKQITLTGNVFDLSRSGACINFSNTHDLIIERGDVIKDCGIDLPGVFSVTFDFSVRFAKINRANKTQIGGYFVNITSKSQKKLDSFIARLEREIIRNQRNFL